MSHKYVLRWETKLGNKKYRFTAGQHKYYLFAYLKKLISNLFLSSGFAGNKRRFWIEKSRQHRRSLV